MYNNSQFGIENDQLVYRPSQFDLILLPSSAVDMPSFIGVPLCEFVEIDSGWMLTFKAVEGKKSTRYSIMLLET